MQGMQTEQVLQHACYKELEREESSLPCSLRHLYAVLYVLPVIVAFRPMRKLSPRRARLSRMGCVVQGKQLLRENKAL